MERAEGRHDPGYYIVRKWPGFHKIADQKPVFHVCIPDPRSNAGLCSSLHTGELVRGVADHLLAQDFQEVGIFSHDNLKGQGCAQSSSQKANIFVFIHAKHCVQRACHCGLLCLRYHNVSLSSYKFLVLLCGKPSLFLSHL